MFQEQAYREEREENLTCVWYRKKCHFLILRFLIFFNSQTNKINT